MGENVPMPSSWKLEASVAWAHRLQQHANTVAVIRTFLKTSAGASRFQQPTSSPSPPAAPPLFPRELATRPERSVRRTRRRRTEPLTIELELPQRHR